MGPYRDRPLPPNSDDFYAAPKDFAQAAPGTILRSREVTVGVFGKIGIPNRAWQILYRTADHEGVPQTTVATLIEPTGQPLQRRPLLSFQCAIDSLSPLSFPSYALQRGARSYGSATRWELLVIGMALVRGWGVVVPDHEGAQGNWGVPRESGYCTLDGIRAARASSQFGVQPDAPTALFGYSGGGLATAWAAELQPTYAPEIPIAGAVLGSPVGNLRNTFLRLAGGPFGGLALAVVAGLYRAYPAFRTDLDAHSTDTARQLLAAASDYSTAGAVLKFRGFDPQSVLTIPLETFLARPSQSAMFADIEPGMSAPVCPLMVVQAVADPIICVSDVDNLVATYRSHGASVDYVRDKFSEHFSALVFSLTHTLDWLSNRIDQIPAQNRTRQTILLTWPRTWFGLLRHGGVVIRFALGSALGRSRGAGALTAGKGRLRSRRRR